jgi:hypothetical protein
VTADELATVVLTFPQTETGTSHGRPAFKAAGKFLTRI